MKYRKLGTSDMNVSEVGLGADTFGRELDEQSTATIIDLYTLENRFDSAII